MANEFDSIELDFLDTSDYGTGFNINDLITAADSLDGKFTFEPNQELLAMMQ